MASRKERVIEAKRSGQALHPQDEAFYQALVKQGLVDPSRMDPETRMQSDDAAYDRETARQLAVEGGGLQQPGPPPATGKQTLATVLGGVGGAVLGSFGGPVGSAIGAGAGSFVGSVLSGRSGQDSLYDALWQTGGDVASTAVASGAKRALAKPISKQSRTALQSPELDPPAADIIAKGPHGTQYQLGTETKEGLKANYSHARDTADRLYDSFKSQMGEVEIADIQKMASEANIPLNAALFGTTVGEGGKVDIDGALQIKSLLGKQARGLRQQGDAVRAAAVERMTEQLDDKLRGAADAAGVGHLYTRANRYFQKNIAERFYNDAVDQIIDFNGRKIIQEMSAEQIGPTARRMTVDDSQRLVTALTSLSDEVPDALPRFRASIVAEIIEQATEVKGDAGVINPAKLLNLTTTPRMQPEVLETLLGKDIAGGLTDFAQAYARGKTRLATVGSLGGVAGASMGEGGTAMGLESFNEMTGLARMIVNTPRVTNKIKMAVLTGDDRGLSTLGLRSIRILGGQASGRLGNYLNRRYLAEQE